MFEELIRARVNALTKKFNEFQPKSKEEMAWRNSLAENKALEWAWYAGILEPKHLPRSVAIRNFVSLGTEDWNRTSWEKYCEKSWAILFWTDISPFPENGPIYRQKKYDPDIPTHEQRENVFISLIECIHQEVVDWVKYCSNMYPDPRGDEFIKVYFNGSIQFPKPTVEYQIAIRQARLRKLSIGSADILDFEQPNWVIEAEYRRLNPYDYK